MANTNFEEALQQKLQFYAQNLIDHPISTAAKLGQLSKEILQEFAALQYIDSVLWVPMLAIMKDRVRHPKLKAALLENLLCEAGAKHTSHITICKEFINSIGVAPYFGDFSKLSPLGQQPVEIMNSVTGLSEGEIAGWILIAEFIVPTLFEQFKPGFEKFPQANLHYLQEHIAVDSDEHAQWMYDACVELQKSGSNQREIFFGIDLGGRTALAVPDALYAKHVRLRKANYIPEVNSERLYAQAV